MAQRQNAAVFDFTGQVVIVTGGTRGLGRVITEQFLAAGADVAICGRNAPSPEETPVSVGPDGVQREAFFVAADIREAEQAHALVAATVEKFGRIDVLVNNAGGGPYAPTAEASPRFSASVITLNLLAPLYCAQAVYPYFHAQESGGNIINIGRVSAVRPSPGSAAYGAAKAGLINLSTSLAVEWAPKIRVNTITAGLLDTGAGPDHYGGEEGMARVAATIPAGRMGNPMDIAGACLYLASDLASFVSGSNLLVHGGGEWPAFIAAAKG